MKMLSSCFSALALVSLALSPPLAANNGLLNGGSASSNAEASYTVSSAHVQSAPVEFHSSVHSSATDAKPPASSLDPFTAEPVEVTSPGSWSFTDDERSALQELALNDSEMDELAGAHAVVVSLGGVILVALLVIIILILLDEINVDELGPDESIA